MDDLKNILAENLIKYRKAANLTQAELAEKGGDDRTKSVGRAEKAPKPKAVTAEAETDRMYCPECGEPLVFEEGCNICKCCGWSKCH